MIPYLHLIDEGEGKTRAEVFLLKDDNKTPEPGINMVIKEDDKSLAGMAATNDKGKVTFEFILKVGMDHQITALAVNYPDISTFENITLVAETKEPTHWIWWVFTGIFMFAAMWFGYPGLIATGLLISLGVMGIASLWEKESGSAWKNFWKVFRPRLLSNNWVFWTYFVLTVYCLVRWIMSFDAVPVPEINLLKTLGNVIKDIVSPPAYNPYGEDEDGAWGAKTLFFLITTILAWPVHFGDDWIEKRKEKHGEEKGAHKTKESHWVLHHVVGEVVGGFIARKIPFINKKPHNTAKKTEAKHVDH